ncbi:MAG: hypothetical protein U5L04_00410 [Trueperaceae bacterium]|nr:hypothetical protein [Trueperaceae bacterium]
MDFDKTEAENVLGKKGDSNLRLNIQKHLGMAANPVDMVLMVGKRKTDFLTEYGALFREKLSIVFEDYAKKNGDWFSILESWVSDHPFYSHGLFTGVPFYGTASLKFKTRCFYAAYERLTIISSLAREAENLALEDAGLPRVGEGWKSEVMLLRKLESEFAPYTKVIHHGRPTWLGRQHFDIWMPHWKVAVEYHGAQHFEPVEFFGGREAFEETRKRDQRKMALAKENGVKLLVIDKDSDQEKLIETIYEFLKSRKVSLKPIQ